MIMINEQWEQVKDLSDILRIVSENIGSEFAQKVEEIFEEQEEKVKQEIYDLENQVDDLQEKVDDCNDLIIKMKNFIEDTQIKYNKIAR